MAKASRLLFAFAAALTLAACTTTSDVRHVDGSVEKVTDFKASADANARMYEAQADVMWKAHEAVQKCFGKANSDVQIMACTMQAQSANFSQALAGRPQPNRNPTAGAEANATVGTATVKATGTAVTAAVVGSAAADVAQSIKPAAPNVANSYNTSTTTSTVTAAEPGVAP